MKKKKPSILLFTFSSFSGDPRLFPPPPPKQCRPPPPPKRRAFSRKLASRSLLLSQLFLPWLTGDVTKKRKTKPSKIEKKKLSLWSTRRKSSARSSSTTTRTRECFRSKRERRDGERGREGEGKAEREAKRARRAEQRRGGEKAAGEDNGGRTDVLLTLSRAHALLLFLPLSPLPPPSLSLSLSQKASTPRSSRPTSASSWRQSRASRSPRATRRRWPHGSCA